MTGVTTPVGAADAAALVSRWWSRPLPEDVLAWDDTWALARDLAEGLGCDPDAAEHLAAASRVTGNEGLLAEYERLFVGPARPPCPPYESLWRSGPSKLEQGRLLGSPSAAVTELYAELGLDLSADAHELPDHVAIEWEALSYALTKGGDGGESVASRLLHEHMRVWMPAFCDAVDREARHPFYRALATLTVDWVEGLAGGEVALP